MTVRQADSVFNKTKVAQLVAQLFVGGVLVSAAMPASAASCTWNTTAGNWAALVNWASCAVGNGNPASTPGAADSATIGAAGAVTIDTGQSIFTLSNAGTINIDAFGLNLVGGGSTTNTGTINVGGPSTANIGVSSGHNITNTGGTINIANGSVINQFGSAITGGTIATTAAGNLVAFSSGSNFLSGVTLNGNLDMASIANSRQRIANGLTVNGVVSVANGGILSFDSSATSGGNQTIGGTGFINLNDAGARISLEGTGTTTFGSGLTIRGQGAINNAIFVGGAQSLVNNGLISADVAAGTLNIQPPGGTITNNGTLQAQNGGTLLLSSDVINNGAGQIVAGIGSTVRQNGVRISGTINTSGSGSFAAISSASNILDAVTLNGTLDLTSIANARERIANGITFTPGSVINVASGGILSLDSSLTPGGNQTIGGTGTINLNDAGARITLEGSGITTIGAGVTIRGEGAINNAIVIGGAQSLVNNGLISADVAGGTLNVQPPGGTITNNATLEAKNGGTLLLSSDVINNAGGQIVAGAGSTVRQNGVRVSGTINTSGSGSFAAISSFSNILDAVTLNGTLDLTSIANARERVANGITFTPGSAINVANGGILSLDSSLTTGGNQTIGGTGTINLNDAAARITLEGTGTTTIGAGVTIRGQGAINNAINIGGVNNLVNNGLISADVAGGTLNLAPPAGFTNNGTLQAQNGGTLQLSSNVIGGATSQINALGAGSAVVQNGVTLSGNFGLTTSGAGIFRVTNNGGNNLSGVTFTGGTVDMTAVSQQRVSGGLTLNSTTINVNSGSSIFALNTQTIGGTGGTIAFGATGANRISLEGNGTTTIGAGTTINGQNGTIGGGQTFLGGANNLVNQGTIAASVAGGTINIQSAGGGTFTNNGLVNASAGTLNVLQAVSGTGTLQTSGTGQLNLANVANSTGQLIANGANAGSTNIGTGNLTVSVDYNNANFGAGNGFNRRANIAGTGQILAASNVAQGISGTGVTNGSTATPTIALGNVRVGAPTTQSFQVTNTGTTGPSLRGAIQTAGGGAGLADARLTVTPQNFGPVATGGASAPINITFNAPTAGLITLSGSNKIGVVNNFDNVAGQLVNITTAAGATAYNVAQAGAVAPNPVTIGNQRIGGTATTALTISNTQAAAGPTEGLNATFGTPSTTQVTTNGGSVAQLAALANNNTSMRVGVDTATAGAKSGTVAVNLTTGGIAGASGLSELSLGSQSISVSGNVYQIAQPSPSPLPTTVNLGNYRAGVGAQSQSINITNTNIAPTGFQEGLNVNPVSTPNSSATGIFNLAAGLTGAVTVGLGSSIAGVNNGVATFQMQSNGTGTSGLGNLNLGGVQTVNVTGTGWRLAEANAQPVSINFGNVLQGSSQAQFLNIQNTAIADGFSERLDARFLTGGTTGAATNNGGSISLLGAGLSNNAAMSVGVNTGSIGAQTGQVIVAFDSNGAATSGLGITGLPNQNIGILANVQVNVGTLAQPTAIAPNPVNFGNFRVGAAGAGPVNLSISNGAVVGEGLNAAISTGSAGFAATGAFTGLAPTATNNSSLQVSFNGTGSAGAKSGSATVALVSDGTFNAGTPTTLVSQTVNMIANVFNTAVGNTTPTPIVMNRRVGEAANQVLTVANTASAGAFSEALNATFTGATGSAGNNGGSVSNLIAGGNNTGAMSVSLNTATAGAQTGSVTLGYQTDGTGSNGNSGLSAAAAGSQTISVSGNVYTAAVGLLNTLAVNFGIVRVGDSVAARNIAVQNTAGASALNDNLRANLGGVGGPFNGSNTVDGLGAGASGNIAVGLNTSGAGVFNQNGAVSFLSYNADMADVSAGTDGQVSVTAQVNNYANAVFTLLSGFGTLTFTGEDWVLNLGNVVLNSTSTRTIRLKNDVSGPADTLGGAFSLVDNNDFDLTGFDAAVSGLGAGQSSGNLDLSFDALALGLFQDIIDFDGFGTNASDPLGVAQHRRLTILANVIDNNGNEIPEPGTLALLLLAAAGAVLARRRRIMAH